MRKQSHKWSLYAPLGDGKEGNLSPLWLPRETWAVSSIHIVVSGFFVGWADWMRASFKAQQCCWKLWWGFNESHWATLFPRITCQHFWNKYLFFFFFFQKSFQLTHLLFCAWEKPYFHMYEISSKQEHLTKPRASVTPCWEREAEDPKPEATQTGKAPKAVQVCEQRCAADQAAFRRAAPTAIHAAAKSFQKHLQRQWTDRKCWSPHLLTRSTEGVGL